MVALALLVAATGPFDRVFADQRGAHLAVSFDAARADASEVADTGELAAGSAGPFAMASLDLRAEVGDGPGRTTEVDAFKPTFAAGVVGSATALEELTRRSGHLDARVATETWGGHTATATSA